LTGDVEMIYSDDDRQYRLSTRKMIDMQDASPRRGWTLAVVCIGTFMLMLDLSVVAIALPDIHRSLGADLSGLQWVVDAYALALAVFLVTAGSLGDLRGRKRMFLAGFGVFTLASLACGLAGSIDVLGVSRAVQGIGAAMLFATGPALIGHLYHGKDRAMAFGLYGASAGLAIAGGPIVGGALISAADWRWIFFINIPVGVLAIFATLAQVPESRDVRARAIDWAGMTTLTAALSALVFAIIRGNAEGWTSPLILGCFAAFAVLLAAFVLIEHTLGERAMFELKLFRNVTFVGMSLVALIANGAGLPSVFIETNYMQNLLHSSAWEAGLRFLPLTLALFVFGAVGGAMTGRVPFRALMGAACAAIGAGLLLTRLAGADSTWTALIPSMIVTGAGMGLFNPTRAALAISVTEPARAGVASGINESFQQVGAAIGIAAIGALFEHRVTDQFASSAVGQQLGASAHDAGQAISAGSIDAVARSTGGLADQALVAARDAFAGGFHTAMTVCAVLAGVAAIVAVFMLRTQDLHSTALSLIPPDLDDPDGPSDSDEADTRVVEPMPELREPQPVA
jgi:EmrB/QacA subfamily drug resistance transporter